MMKISHFLSISVLSLCSFAASAATVWQPTNADVNFIQLDFGNDIGILTHGGTLALFDNGYLGDSSKELDIGTAGGKVSITNTGSGWQASLTGPSPANTVLDGPISLSGGPQFTLGMTWGNGKWYDVESFFANTPNTYQINFSGYDATGAPVKGSTIGVDLQPVPVPAAAWLFGTGLLGLVGVARRRRT